jgi:hypothetical protein
MPLNTIDRKKQISEFRASLILSNPQVEKKLDQGMDDHTFNPSIQKTEACRSLSSRSVYRVNFRTAKLGQ